MADRRGTHRDSPGGATLNKSKRLRPAAILLLGCGGRYTGRYEREFAAKAGAEKFVCEVKGKPVAVHCDPDKPAASWLPEAAVNVLLDESGATPPSVPPLLRPLLPALVGISAVGLVVSLWVHLGAVTGRRVAPAALFWILHASLFLVFFPAVWILQRSAAATKRMDFWKDVLRECPAWMRYMVYGFFVYALVNLWICGAPAASGGGGANPSVEVWRAFSGHWMVCYSAALAVPYWAERNAPRCPNGHTTPPGARSCERCGQPVTGWRPR
jgi:hypothetical protein